MSLLCFHSHMLPKRDADFMVNLLIKAYQLPRGRRRPPPTKMQLPSPKPEKVRGNEKVSCSERGK